MKSFWFDEFERMNRILRDLRESPARNFLREIEQYRQLPEPPGYRALRELQDDVAAGARQVHESLTSGFSSIVSITKRSPFTIKAGGPTPERAFG